MLNQVNSTTLLHSVSMIGSEGKGKSTMCNAMFRTAFSTPRANRRILSRTTNGVDAATRDGLVILDVEGFDSSVRQVIPREEVKGLSEERKADRTTGEKLALFALLSTNLIIINLAYNDCGCYSSSGIKILETIFEATKQLHREQRLLTPIKIVFFVRDVDSPDRETGSEDEIQNQVEEALKLRVDVAFARTGLEGSEIYSLISCEVFTFPHYQYRRDLFNAKVAEVRDVLTSMIRRSPGRSAELIPTAYKTIWDRVWRNQRMNLPDLNSVMRRLEEEVLRRERRLQEEEASSTILRYALGAVVGLFVGVGCVIAAPAIASAGLVGVAGTTAAAGASFFGAMGGRGR